MTKIKKGTSADKQYEYARLRVLGKSTSKAKTALAVGYSETTAKSIVSHVEEKEGYKNAVAQLARESNTMALKAMDEFKRRGFEGFSNKDLVGALNAIGNAWSRFNGVNTDDNRDKGGNRLRTVILQRVENQTLNTPSANIPAEIAPDPQVIEEVKDIIDVEVKEEEF